VPTTDPVARTTIYAIQAEDHELAIVLDGEPCHDSMSGEAFETAVTVIMVDKKFRGCGKALH
jgi:uncharacterized membrane protein